MTEFRPGQPAEDSLQFGRQFIVLQNIEKSAYHSTNGRKRLYKWKWRCACENYSKMYKNWTSSAAAAPNSGAAMNPSGYQSVLSKLPTEDAKKVRWIIHYLYSFTYLFVRVKILKVTGYRWTTLFGE